MQVQGCPGPVKDFFLSCAVHLRSLCSVNSIIIISNFIGKIQVLKNANLAGICAIVNIDFQIPHALSSIIGLLISIKFEQQYIVKLTKHSF